MNDLVVICCEMKWLLALSFARRQNALLLLLTYACEVRHNFNDNSTQQANYNCRPAIQGQPVVEVISQYFYQEVETQISADIQHGPSLPLKSDEHQHKAPNEKHGCAK